ncbi:hypothetical protein AF450_14570 [Listeria monocytogenes]|nr:hypothetical protein [Listeria monocytogenes]
MTFEITNLNELMARIEKITDLDMKRIDMVLNDNTNYVVNQELCIGEDLLIGYFEAIIFKVIKVNESHVVLTYTGTTWV